jgi:glycosyltransferase involved in cell wall biosynthesis
MIQEGFQVDLQRVKTTWMQLLPFKRQFYKMYFLLYPLACRGLNLSSYDLVLTSSSYAAINAKGKLTICYCHTPSRYLYGYDTELDHAKLKRYFPFLEWLYSVVRKWDQAAAQRVDQFVANSDEVKKRIKKIYDRDSIVIYPPVETEKFAGLIGKAGDYYFTFGRLVAHKRTDLLVQVFNELGWPLKIAGEGLELINLKKMAKGNIEFLGRVSAMELKNYLANCRAVLFVAEEDFGIVPVEAMAAGKAVIAFEAGGVLESVIPGVTGEFFSPQTAEGLKKVLTGFDPKKYDARTIKSVAAKFNKNTFQTKIKQLTQILWINKAKDT